MPWEAVTTLTLPSSAEVGVIRTYVPLAPVIVFSSPGNATELVCVHLSIALVRVSSDVTLLPGAKGSL
jgi:hypothetical protein